jgi:nicotinate-nucleotide adenylyltransferase
VKRIGLFGGTFDPVHIGHLIIASYVYEIKKLSKVIFIPSCISPHKESETMFDAEARLNMISLATKGDERFAVSDIEIRRKGFSYTIDTIREIKKEFNGVSEFYFIIGTDNLYEFETWKEPAEILKELKLLTVRRKTNNTREIPGWVMERTELIDIPLLDISSTEIRDRIKNDKEIRYFVTEPVEKIIRNHRI